MKKWNKPQLIDLSVQQTKSNNLPKCTNNNGNGNNCIHGYVGPMFLCPSYVKNGHLCNKAQQPGDMLPDAGTGEGLIPNFS